MPSPGVLLAAGVFLLALMRALDLVGWALARWLA